MRKHLCYFHSEKEVQVGHIAIFGKYGQCEVIELNNGEALGRNLVTQEEFWYYCTDLDFLAFSKEEWES